MKKIILTTTLALLSATSYADYKVFAKNTYINLPESSSVVSENNTFNHLRATNDNGIIVDENGNITVWGKSTEIKNQYPENTNFVFLGRGNHAIAGIDSAKNLTVWGRDLGGIVSQAPSQGSFSKAEIGYDHALALTDNGEIVVWGRNYDWHLKPTDSEHIDIGATNRTGFALDKNGYVKAWGENGYQEVSDKPTDSGYVRLIAGNHSVAAIKSDGSFSFWGRESNYVPNDLKVKDLDIGGFHVVALLKDGSLRSWGVDSDGVVSNTPSGNDYINVEAGKYFSIAEKENGELIVWGENDDREVSDAP